MSKRNSLMCRVLFSTRRIDVGPSTLRWCQDPARPDQVVRRGCERHDPTHEFGASVPQFAQPTNGLHPPEHLLNQLPFPLTDGVPSVTRRAPIKVAHGTIARNKRVNPGNAKELRIRHAHERQREKAAYVTGDR
jgi:hypothetical protein